MSALEQQHERILTENLAVALDDYDDNMDILHDYIIEFDQLPDNSSSSS